MQWKWQCNGNAMAMQWPMKRLQNRRSVHVDCGVHIVVLGIDSYPRRGANELILHLMFSKPSHPLKTFKNLLRRTTNLSTTFNQKHFNTVEEDGCEDMDIVIKKI